MDGLLTSSKSTCVRLHAFELFQWAILSITPFGWRIDLSTFEFSAFGVEIKDVGHCMCAHASLGEVQWLIIYLSSVTHRSR